PVLPSPAVASSARRSGPPGVRRTAAKVGKMAVVTGQSPLPEVPPGLSVLEAVLERITYANEDNGYTIARVATERTGPDLLTVVGPLLGAQVGESLRLTGRWGSHPSTASSSRCTPSPPCFRPRSRAFAATPVRG